MSLTTIILTGGGAAPSRSRIPAADLVIAADSGLHLAAGLGLHVDLVVGDLDSVRSDALAAARAAGAAVEQHPRDKDATDLDLAMAAAVDRGSRRIAIVGGGGGRLDHLLGIAGLAASPRWVNVDVEWHTPEWTIRPVRSHLTLVTADGDAISLIPIGGDATVSLRGTRWLLDGESLAFGSTRGISNEAVGDTVSLDVHDGVVLLAHSGGMT